MVQSLIELWKILIVRSVTYRNYHRTRVRARARAMESDPFLTLFAPKWPKNPVRGSLLSGRVTPFLEGVGPSWVTFWPRNDPSTTPPPPGSTLFASATSVQWPIICGKLTPGRPKYESADWPFFMLLHLVQQFNSRVCSCAAMWPSIFLQGRPWKSL